MYSKLEQRLARLLDLASSDVLQENRIGLEKESLRVDRHGGISQTPHPVLLGAALTHPYITTDYSEALLECVTPALVTPSDTLQFLADTHQYIYHQLDNELLWATSMPCVLDGEKSIRIARYGSSNQGQMKHIYRRGLGSRYGRVMQVIAGVHFNFSLAPKFWPLYQYCEDNGDPLRTFNDQEYFALIRNLLRFGWLIPYLFGASPAVCKSFLGARPSRMQAFNATTYYEPYATSLRMGDIGYQNNQEGKTGVKVSYDNLESYVQSLQQAIRTPSADYQRIGVVVLGKYRQLNSNILQIENEYYSSVRPKQPPLENEMPSLALKSRGIRYIELRSLDVNVFHPVGIEEDQLLFLEGFFLFCLLHDSPPISEQEGLEIDHNLNITAHKGREPNLQLRRQGKDISLREWALELCKAMQGPCEWLDQKKPEQSSCYTQALQHQWETANNPEETPSARILTELSDSQEGFFEFAQRRSLEHQRTFQKMPKSEEKFRLFDTLRDSSLAQQKALEKTKQIPFETFLQHYFSQ